MVLLFEILDAVLFFGSWTSSAATCLILYLCSVALLRWRRASTTPKRYNMESSVSLGKMTNDDAQAILKDLTEMEFPRVMGLSIIFAIFKTYGIPTMSSLLVATGQLASPETASKRTADTGVLLLEFTLNKPSSDRTIKAISRMNYLHQRYQRSGKIQNSDMLYTLSLFALEPIRWVDKYEWRAMTDIERCASGTFWKAMGDAMSISFDELPSCKDGWTDGLHWLDEIENWSLRYEATNMTPAATNRQMAEAHLDVLFLNVPSWLNQVGTKVVSVLVGERLQKAMILPKASPTYHVLISTILYIRKAILRYLALPRPEFMRKTYIPSAPDTNTGRYNSVKYLSYPWYVKPTFQRRWGPRALVTRLLGRRLPGDDGNKYAPKGYIFEEIGPEMLSGKGIKDMRDTESRLNEARRGGCPFTLS